MKIKPSIVIADLEEYLELFNISLSEQARQSLMDIEEFAYRCDNPANTNLFFSKVIRNSEILQNILIDKGINPNLAALILEKSYYDSMEDLTKYREDNFSYSQIYMRRENVKTDIIDRALEYCVIENRDSLQNKDIFLGAMDHFEDSVDQDHSHWTDKALEKTSMTLSHVLGHYNKNLWIHFDDIREAILNPQKFDNYIQTHSEDTNIFLHYYPYRIQKSTHSA